MLMAQRHNMYKINTKTDYEHSTLIRFFGLQWLDFLSPWHNLQA